MRNCNQDKAAALVFTGEEYPHVDDCSLPNIEKTLDVVTRLGWTNEDLLIDSRRGARAFLFTKRPQLLRGTTSFIFNKY